MEEIKKGIYMSSMPEKKANQDARKATSNIENKPKMRSKNTEANIFSVYPLFLDNS